jgi:hypothetical protein
METFAFNISKGRAVELYRRVDENDPATAALVLVPLSAGGTEAQGQDFDDLKALLEDANFTEETEGEWERKVFTDTELAAQAVDDENNRNPFSLPETAWGEPTTTVVGFVLCYDPKAGEGEDDELVPIAAFDKEVKGDGNTVAQEAGEAYRAS